MKTPTKKKERKLYGLYCEEDELGLGDCPRIFYKKSEAQKWHEDYRGSLQGRKYKIVEIALTYKI